MSAWIGVFRCDGGKSDSLGQCGALRTQSATGRRSRPCRTLKAVKRNPPERLEGTVGGRRPASGPRDGATQRGMLGLQSGRPAEVTVDADKQEM